MGQRVVTFGDGGELVLEFASEVAEPALALMERALHRAFEEIPSLGAGQALQIGWLKCLIDRTADGRNTLWEPDFRYGPLPASPLDPPIPRFENNAGRVTRILADQLTVLQSVGALDRAAFPRFDAMALVCSRFPTAERVVELYRREPTHPDDSGWFIGCDDETHEHGSGLFELSLYGVTVRRPEIVTYLALPPGFGVLLARDPDQAVILESGKPERRIDKLYRSSKRVVPSPPAPERLAQVAGLIRAIEREGLAVPSFLAQRECEAVLDSLRSLPGILSASRSFLADLSEVKGDHLGLAGPMARLPHGALRRTEGGLLRETYFQFEVVVLQQPQGWRTLEFLAWFFRDQARAGASVQLRPFALPPVGANGPQLGRTLRFHVDVFARGDATEVVSAMRALGEGLRTSVSAYSALLGAAPATSLR